MANTVTLIITAYRASSFLNDCINSILSQVIPEAFELEILLCVDGCNKTWKSLHKFENINFTYILLNNNYGPYIAFNTAMDLASGNIIFRFDIDDIMLDNYLSDQIELLHDNAIDITRTWSIYTNKFKKPIVHKLRDGTITTIDGKRFKGSDGQFAMKKSVWKQLGGFQPWRCFGDTDFMIRSKYVGCKLQEVPKHLYLRRIHKTSLTQSLYTGYDSEMRKMHKEELLSRSILYQSGTSCYIEPVKGIIADIRKVSS